MANFKSICRLKYLIKKRIIIGCRILRVSYTFFLLDLYEKKNQELTTLTSKSGISDNNNNFLYVIRIIVFIILGFFFESSFIHSLKRASDKI